MDDPAERLRAGDADAFGEFFDSCAKAGYNHAFRLIGDWPRRRT
jgi:RNA polymerase sigma-70 factor (ECF subfamily)